MVSVRELGQDKARGFQVVRVKQRAIKAKGRVKRLMKGEMPPGWAVWCERARVALQRARID